MFYFAMFFVILALDDKANAIKLKNYILNTEIKAVKL